MRPSRPGLTALAAFFVFGALAGGLSAITLVYPGTALDQLWRLNERGHRGLLGLGGWAVVLMVAVSLACSLAARGLWIRARWGRRLAIAILAANLIGDAVNAVVLGDLRTLVGVPIAAALIVYLLSPGIVTVFEVPEAAA